MISTEENKKTLSIVLLGRPITKKNHTRNFRSKYGKNIVLQSEAYIAYENSCLWQTKAITRGYSKENAIFNCLINMQCIYYMPNRKGWPDLIGLLQATSDILQECHIIRNDSLVATYDGSRIAGIDKANPRAEIIITTFG